MAQYAEVHTSAGDRFRVSTEEGSVVVAGRLMSDPFRVVFGPDLALTVGKALVRASDAARDREERF